MKKFLSIVLTLVLLLSTAATTYASVGDVIGTAYNTDIVAYINNYAIPSYAVNGTSVVVAEDLRNFGFDVVWDSNTKSLTISRNSKTSVSEMNFTKTGVSGSKFADLLSTDISVYANGKKLTSYAINGYTMIPMEELTMFGKVYWNEEQRAIRLWVDGLSTRYNMQGILGKYYTKSTVETYTYVTGQVPTTTTCVEGHQNGGLFDVLDQYTYVYTYKDSGKDMENYMNSWGEYLVSLVKNGAIYVEEYSYGDEEDNISRFFFYIGDSGELCIDVHVDTGTVEVHYAYC